MCNEEALICLRIVSSEFTKTHSAFSTIINIFDKYYGTRALRHVIFNVDIVTYENSLHDIIFIIISEKINQDK